MSNENETKEELTSEKAENRVAELDSLEKLQEIQMQESKKTSEELDNLIEELQAGDYFGREYGKDSTVAIPGQMFSNMVSFIQSQMKTHYSVESTLQILYNTNDAMITNLSKMMIDLMKQHKTNVDLGVTITSEELDKEEAVEKVKEVEIDSPKRKTSKKARGSEA